MPNYRVGDTPVQLAQSGARGFLVRNVGTVPVFLEEGSTVSSTAYGLELQPLDSANWPQDKALWIATAQGAVGDISVLYGAEGVSLGAVSAVVTGDVVATITGPVDANITNASIPVTGDVDANITNAIVNVGGNVDANITNADIAVSGTVDANITNATIDATITGDVVVTSGTVNVGGILTPVVVQGGGVMLLQQTGTVNAATGTTINVPAPTSGNVFFGIGIIVTVTSKTVSNDNPLNVSVYNFGFTTAVPTRLKALLGVGGGLNLGSFGQVSTASVVVPMATSYPLRIDLDNTGAAGNQTYRITVIGLSTAGVQPQDLIQWENGLTMDVSFTSALANSYALIASSTETRQFLINSLTATTGAFVVESVSSAGVWSVTQQRAHNSVYGNQPSGADISANVNSLVTIPGDGFVHRVRVSNAVTGAVSMSYLGKA
jgi:hypothetical protein